MLMEEKWVVAAKRADFYGIAERFGIDPVTARLIRNRDIVGDEAIGRYLHGTLDDCHAPSLLPDIEEAIDVILSAIEEDMPIRICGDYDIDGVVSSYILLQGLARLGADVDVRIPERMRDGYGLNERLIRQAKADGKALLITCDNGIAAADEMALAYELGLRAVITDHHEVPFEEADDGSRTQRLPRAEAVIDPKRQDAAYPFQDICGATVAWKLILALYEAVGIEESEAEELLPFVAMATVGDVCPLVDENRILVREGLRRLKKTQNPGLLELISQNGLEADKIDVYHIGFVIGPCLNASGRLDTAIRALELFCAEDRQEAAKIAGDLIVLNASRKEMTRISTEEAMRIVETEALGRERVLVIFLPDCHESLAGIVAGRVRERYHRPAIVITRTERGAKGSGRSIEAYNMFEALQSCKDLLLRFGGHKMAAGITIEEDKIDALRARLNQEAKLSEDDLAGKIVIDVAMPISYISRRLVEEIDLLRPFGVGNTKPVFAAKDLTLTDPRVFGANQNVVKCRARDASGAVIDAVYFGESAALVELVRKGSRFALLYEPSIDDYNGRNTLQITIRAYRQMAASLE